MLNGSDGSPQAHPAMPWTPGPYGPTPLADHNAELRSLREAVATLTARNEAVGDHETRIRALESRNWPLPVVVALTGTGAVLVACAALLLAK
nr:hypothetical protein OG409_28120 [Streptomyces sp. NBC_00974]